MNFNDFNSEQYRKAFDSLSAISKSIAPQIKALQNATVAMPGNHTETFPLTMTLLCHTDTIPQ